LKKGRIIGIGGLYEACKHGHIDIINILIENGANRYHVGLEAACEGGHMDIVNMMINKGANNWDRGLVAAYRGDHTNIIKLMLQKGAKYPDIVYKYINIPKDDPIIEVIYCSMYDYLPDEMINEVLKYATVEDFNLQEWLILR